MKSSMGSREYLFINHKEFMINASRTQGHIDLVIAAQAKKLVSACKKFLRIG